MKSENRNPALCRTFIDKAKGILAHYPEIKHSWSIDADEDHCILDIPKMAEDGFNIYIEVFADDVIVSANGPHIHYHLGSSVETVVDDALGLVRDLLSPSMRIREFYSNGKPYKWYMELIHDGKWQVEDKTYLIFFNWFGKRTEKYYQNSILPSRL